jgi:hypothetical protein
MSGPNGHAEANDSSVSNPLTAAPSMPSASPFTPEKVKELVAALEVPFDPSQIEWRVMNTTKNGQPMRGQVVPYADQRAYTDRLNALFTPAGWTRKYAIHTSANFERSQDKKTVAKVLVSCELTIFGVGSHSATGEEFADDPNALTAAEAQAFKRAAVCFGLGRYLYYFTGSWVDDIHFFFLWLKSVDLALSRVKERVSRGGHDVPEPVIRRRFDRSMENFLLHYRPLAEVWTLFDNSGKTPKMIALERDKTICIIDKGTYTALVKRYGRT